MNAGDKKKILIVAHDAGGAEVLSAYIAENRKKFRFLCFAAGPAATIFTRSGVPFKRAPEDATRIADIFAAQKDIALVLTGTGWMTKVEINFIKEAKRHGLQSAAFIDHWVNYRERFGFPRKGWRKNLPDRIWVADRTALKMAQKLFPQIKIKRIPNYYLLHIAKEYAKLERKKTDGRGILFMSEPLRGNEHISRVRRAHRFSEFQALKDILSVTSTLKKKTTVIIRFHPSEKTDKYDGIIKRYSDRVQLVKSVKKDFVNDMLKAKLVIGMTSMSLIAALACNKKTVSYVPARRGTSMLPARNLIKIRTYPALHKIIKAFV